MPTLRVELFEGRSPEQKAALARELTEACVRVLGGSLASARQPVCSSQRWSP
jgi:phenylpyruvate tautomerase PptA (4-oxalocrotonate tautomerase family)